MQVHIDMTSFRSAIGHDHEAEKVLLRLFIETVDSAFSGISCDSPQDIWISQFHLIKGAAGNVGAMQLAEIADRAQKSYQLNVEERQKLLNDALEIYAQFRAYYVLLAE